jgi:SAM-dependent methyltransferase
MSEEMLRSSLVLGRECEANVPILDVMTRRKPLARNDTGEIENPVSTVSPVDGLPVSEERPGGSLPTRAGQSTELTKTKQRVADHGEVFTPEWLVEEMLDLVKDEAQRIDSRFLEPACGSGNFLVKILQRKLAAVEAKYAKSEFERRNFALLAVMCIYGIELLDDNIVECRENLLAIFAEYLALDTSDDIHRAAHHVLSVNLVHGDAMKMTTVDGGPIVFAEWGYLGKGKFQRRDFRLDMLTLSSAFSAEDSLFSSLGRHEIFIPSKTYESMTATDIAALASRSVS